MSERFLSIDCKGEELAAILHEPTDQVRNVSVLIVVGGPQYRVGSHRQFVLMARRFAEAGYPVLRFDYRGMGDSTGGPRTFEDVGDDIDAAVKMLQALPKVPSKIVVLGLCDAASAAMIYCSTNPRMGGLVLVNPWARTDAGVAKAHVRHYYFRRILQQSFWSKALSGDVEVLSSLRNFAATLRRSVGGWQSAHDAGPEDFLGRMAKGLSAFAGPVLLVMSGRDLTSREFDDMCRASRQWSSLVTRPGVARAELPEADHTFSTAGALEAASQAVVQWLRANCDEPHDADSDSAPGRPPVS